MKRVIFLVRLTVYCRSSKLLRLFSGTASFLFSVAIRTGLSLHDLLLSNEVCSNFISPVVFLCDFSLDQFFV